MFLPARWAVGVPLGLLGFLGAILLEGGHPTMLLQSTALVTVLGTAFGGLLALRGPAALAAVFRTAWLGAPTEAAARDERLRDFQLLERLSLLGACLALFWGGTRAIASYRTPEQIGPALAVAIVSVVLALLFNVLFVMPLKQHLLPTPAPEERLPSRTAAVRALQMFGSVALFVAGTAFLFDGATAGQSAALVQVPALLMVLGAVLPSLLAAPTAMNHAVSRTRCRWFADAMWSAGTLAATHGVMHVFSVLDHPSLIAPGVAVAFAGFALPAAFATLANLRGSLAPTDAAATTREERSPYVAFAALVLAALAGMVLFVTMVLSRMPSTHA